jgi:hypothetical protein
MKLPQSVLNIIGTYDSLLLSNLIPYPRFGRKAIWLREATKTKLLTHAPLSWFIELTDSTSSQREMMFIFIHHGCIYEILSFGVSKGLYRRNSPKHNLYLPS